MRHGEINVHRTYMLEAIAEARLALANGEVPIGAVVVWDGRIIGRGHNRREQWKDPTAHAEILAIQEAAQYLGQWRLTNASLYVTLEPCPMCAGALRWAQLSRLVYGASDEKRGYSTISPFLLHPKTTVTKGILAEDCSDLMQLFFKKIR